MNVTGLTVSIGDGGRVAVSGAQGALAVLLADGAPELRLDDVSQVGTGLVSWPAVCVRSPCDERLYLWKLLDDERLVCRTECRDVSRSAEMCAMSSPWSARFPLSKRMGSWLYTVKLLLATSKVHGDLKNWSRVEEKTNRFQLVRVTKRLLLAGDQICGLEVLPVVVGEVLHGGDVRLSVRHHFIGSCD